MAHITLNDMERRLVVAVAEARTTTKRSHQVVNQKIGPQSDQETERFGIAGEIAAAKAFNVYPDLRIHTGGDDYDLIIEGRKADIKTSKRPDGNLIADRKRGSAEIYILVCAETVNGKKGFTIVGWATTEELFKEENITDLGHGPTYLIPRDKLRPIK